MCNAYISTLRKIYWLKSITIQTKVDESIVGGCIKMFELVLIKIDRSEVLQSWWLGS